MDDASRLQQFRCAAEFGIRTAWVEVQGELDLATVPVLEKQLHEALSRTRIVVLDLRRLSFIDAAGLRVILAGAEHALHVGRRLLVMRGPAHVHRVFVLIGAAERLVTFDLAADDHADGAKILLREAQGRL